MKNFKSIVLIYLSIIMVVTMVLPYVFMGNVAYAANDGTTDNTENKDDKTTSTNLLNSINMAPTYDKYYENFKFNEEVYKFLIKEFIFGTNNMVSDSYLNLFAGGEGISLGGVTLQNPKPGDLVLGGEGTAYDKGKAKSIARTPIFTMNSDYDDRLRDGKLGKQQDKLTGDRITKANDNEVDAVVVDNPATVQFIGGNGNYLRLDGFNRYSSLFRERKGGLNFGKYKAVRLSSVFDLSEKYESTNFSLNPNGYLVSIAVYLNSDSISGGDLFLDTYGNIVTDKGHIIVPVWMNGVLGDDSNIIKSNSKAFLSNPFNTLKSSEGSFLNVLSTDIMLRDNIKFNELQAANAKQEGKDTHMTKKLANAFVGNSGIFKDLNKKTIPSGETGDKRGTHIEGKLKEIYLTEKEYQEDIVNYIFKKTKDHAKAYNDKMLDFMKKSKDMENIEIYVDESKSNVASGSSDLDSELEYINSASNLLARFSRLLDVGFFTLIKLACAALVSDLYNSAFIGMPVSEVFFTSLISDSALWQSMIRMALLGVVSFTSLYVVYLSFRVFIGTSTAKEVMLRVLVLALAVAAPSLIYSPLVNLMFNKPAEAILNTEMDRMMVLDTWLYKFEDKFRDVVEQAGKSYKDYEPLIRDRAEDYTIEFTTTKTVDGETLDEYSENRKTTAKPSKNSMVTVDVSIFHIYDWLISTVGESGTEEVKDKNDESVLLDESVGLFEFLDMKYGNSLGETSTGKSIYYYEDILSYEEYSYNVSDETSELFNDLNTKNVGEIKASELLRDIYKNLTKNHKDFSTNLYEIMKVIFYDGSVKTDDEDTVTSKRPFTSEEIDFLMNDLSLTSDYRQLITNKSQVSEFTKSVLEQTPNAHFNIDLTDTDLFKFETILEPLKGIRFSKKIELAKEVSTINLSLMEKYTSTYLPLKTTIGVNTESSSEYAKSETFIIALEAYFKVADYYGMSYFPSNVNIKSISLDTFIRMMFIPFNQFEPTDSSLNDVSEFIAVNSSLVELLLFLIFLLVLLCYGMVKWIVLFVLLMPAMFFLFLYNYVIKNNPNNKAWLGAFTILSTFAITNLGLLIVWKGLVYYMNLKEFNIAIEGMRGRTTYVLLNTFIISLYLILAFKFLIIPLLKTVKEDWVNLGGEKFNQKFGDLSAGFSNMLNSMWNSSPYSASGKDKGLLGGGVNQNDLNKAKDSLTAKDTGKAGQMTSATTEINENMSEADKEKLDLVKNKITRAEGTQDTAKKGLIQKAGDLATKVVPNTVSDKFSSIRNKLGNSAYNAISGTGNAVGKALGSNTAGNVARNGGVLLGNAVRTALVGEFGAITDGASAAARIAGVNGNGAIAGLAGGVLGGILAKTKAKILKPYNMMQANSLGAKLGSMKLAGHGNYSDIKDLTPEEIAEIKEAGLHTNLEDLEGVDAGRDKEVARVNVGDTAIASLLEKYLKDKTHVLADGEDLLINLTMDELTQEGKGGQVLDDMLHGLGLAHEDIYSHVLAFNEVGLMPLYTKGTINNDGSVGYSIDSNEDDKERYAPVLNKLIEKYTNEGKLLNVDGNNLTFASDNDAVDFFNKLDSGVAVLNKTFMKEKGPLLYLKESSEITKLKGLLDDGNISYETGDSENTLRLTNMDADSEKFERILDSNRNLAMGITEITNGYLEVANDDIVTSIVNGLLTESNEDGSSKFELNRDFAFKDGNVLALTDEAKVALVNIRENYDEVRVEKLKAIDGITKVIHNTIDEMVIDPNNGQIQFSNSEGTLQFGPFDRTSLDEGSILLNERVTQSTVGKAGFRLTNDLDMDVINDYVSNLRHINNEVLNGKYNGVMSDIESGYAVNPILEEEKQLMDISARMSLRGVNFERLNNGQLNVYAENKEDAKLVTEYIELYEKLPEIRAQHEEAVKLKLQEKVNSDRQLDINQNTDIQNLLKSFAELQRNNQSSETFNADLEEVLRRALNNNDGNQSN